jgi:hypothetical protein
MSHLLLESDDLEELSWQITHDLKEGKAGDDFKAVLEDFTQWTLDHRAFSVAGFANLMESAGLDFENLYTGYIGKNVLNFFRQDHGYQDGSYQKTWDGREDNEHLVEIVAGLDSSSPEFQQELYQGLKDRYTSLPGQ